MLQECHLKWDNSIERAVMAAKLKLKFSVNEHLVFIVCICLCGIGEGVIIIFWCRK